MLLAAIFIFVTVGHFAAGCGGSAAKNPTNVADLDNDGIPNDIDDDADGDGVLKDEDCDDLNFSVNPNIADLPDDDKVDSNCDGFDGNLTGAIWVSEQEGNDSNTGAIDSPLKTIGKAVLVAEARSLGSRDIYIVKGTYAEDVALSDGINLFGGYGLLNSGSRERNISVNETKITGVDNLGKFGVDFEHIGSVDLNYSLLVSNSTQTVIDGLTVEGDSAGPVVILFNSNVSLRRNVIKEVVPAVARGTSFGVGVLYDESAKKDLAVLIQKNRINTFGVQDGTSEADFGLFAVPAKKANVALNVIVDSNTFDCRGDAGTIAAIYAADNDSNPKDNASSDGVGDIFLTATNNDIYVEGNHDLSVGIAGGLVMGDSLIPNEEHDFYLSGATITGNEIEIDGAKSLSTLGIVSELMRKETTISENVMNITGATNQTMGLIAAMGEISLTDNTVTIKSNAGTYGLVIFFNNDAKYSGYTGGLLKDVSSNIFDIANPSGKTIGVAELVATSEPADDVHKASPETFSGNNLYLTPSFKALYSDSQFDGLAITLKSILTLDELNAKTGFASDDPTAISGNISANPN